MAEKTSYAKIRASHHKAPDLHGNNFKFRNSSRRFPNRPHFMQSPQALVTSRHPAQTPKLKPEQNSATIFINHSARPNKKRREKPIQLEAQKRKRLLRGKTIGFLAATAIVLAACYADPNSIPPIDQVDGWKMAFERNPLYYPQLLALFFGSSAGISALLTSAQKHGEKAANPNVHGYNWGSAIVDVGVDTVSDTLVSAYQAAAAMLMYEFGVADRGIIFEKIGSLVPALASLGFGIIAFKGLDNIKDIIGLFKRPTLPAQAATATD